MYRLLILLVFISLEIHAQEPGIAAVGFSAGAMNYIGDLDDDSPVRFVRPAAAINVTALPYNRLNISFSYMHGSVWGDDKEAEQLGNKYRNINFYSNVDELSLLFTFRFQSGKRRFLERKPWIPYVFAGIGYFHFNPKAIVDGVEYELQKIGTEGQQLSTDPDNIVYPEPYKLWQFNIPFGAGIKYKLNRQFDLGLEFSLRKLFTDYLDDISGYYPDKDQILSEEGEVALYLSDPSNDPNRPTGRKSFARRGDPTDLDWYSYTSISINYYFTTKLFRAVQVF